MPPPSLRSLPLCLQSWPRWLLVSVALAALWARPVTASELFPFVLPWDDAAPGAVNVAGWLEAPAGRDGFVTVKDGHLFTGKKRLRIFGVNMAFGGNFPAHADAEKIAARMAKFGINCVRFHHMDMQGAPSGIWMKDMVTIDPERLDRLDYFIAQLKKNGIYANLNLHVSRKYPDRPAAEKVGNPDHDTGVDNFAARLIEMQKDYARTLLTHVNPYTGNAYTNEPAVALIEINNENALLVQVHYGTLDRIAAPYRAELGALSSEWRRAKYPRENALAEAWRVGARAGGAEMLRNTRFEMPLAEWAVEQHQGAKATMEGKEGVARIEVTTPGRAGWHVQWSQSGLVVKTGEPMRCKFRARASAPLKAKVGLSQARGPWKSLASEDVNLTTEWQEFSVLFEPKTDEENARLSFSDMGASAGWVEFAGLSLKTSGLNGSVPRAADGGVMPLNQSDIGGRTEAVQSDWFSFLWSLEQKYWPGMYRFLREELKAKSLIIGTQLGWSPFPIQNSMDVIDSHNYWQHPQFPAGNWSTENWQVKNIAMTGAADGGTLPSLALQRVAGKPYLCTEYNHSAPNSFASETFPLLCAYAALQDWDGVFAFAYSHRTDDWAKGFFPGFFDIDQHPTKMATLPASIALFMRGDVAAAKTASIATMTLSDAVAAVRRDGPRIGAEQLGVPRLAALTQRVGVMLGNQTSLVKTVAPAGPVFSSDTGELQWDASSRVVTVNTARSKAVLGFPQRAYDLGGVKIEFGALRLGFGVVQLTVLDGADFANARRVLITATGDAENTDMKWTSEKKESLGREWGRAPSLVEGIPVKITLPVSGDRKAWALDERGQRRAEIPIKSGIIEIGPQHRALWYEVGE